LCRVPNTHRTFVPLATVCFCPAERVAGVRGGALAGDPVELPTLPPVCPALTHIAYCRLALRPLSPSGLHPRSAATGNAEILKNKGDVGRVPFFAAGISSVMHPRNPHCPTMHFNYRYFETEAWNGIPGQWWFGGGTDITPSFVDTEDMKHFHSTYKQVRPSDDVVVPRIGCFEY
jgi:hypothetical protein